MNIFDLLNSCEGGESVAEMTARVDEVVATIKQIHLDWYNAPNRKETDKGGDILIVSHGHFSRVFLARWLDLPLEQGQLFSLDPGGVGALYNNRNNANLAFQVCVLQYYHKFDRTCLGSMNLGLI